MKQINPHEVEEGHLEEINTKDDLIVLAKGIISATATS